MSVISGMSRPALVFAILLFGKTRCLTRCGGMVEALRPWPETCVLRNKVGYIRNNWSCMVCHLHHLQSGNQKRSLLFSRILFFLSFNLETAVGSQKSAQALGAPGKIKKCLITTKVTATFFISPCTPIAYTAFLRPTAVSRFKRSSNRFPFRVRLNQSVKLRMVKKFIQPCHI